MCVIRTTQGEKCMITNARKKNRVEIVVAQLEHFLTNYWDQQTMIKILQVQI